MQFKSNEDVKMTAGTTIVSRLYLMQVASIVERNLPIVCYLVQFNDGLNVLIDTGLPDIVEPPPGFPMPAMGLNVVEQLASIGVQPSDIQIVVTTHFDLDHVGWLTAFKDAEFIVQRSHYENAQQNPRFEQSRFQWGSPELHFRLIDGDCELLPGLRVIETSGHAKGHMSVLVTLPGTGLVILAIDAVADKSVFVLDRQLRPVDDNLDDLINSTAKIMDIAKQDGASLVIHGHDGEQWENLKKLSQYYD